MKWALVIVHNSAGAKLWFSDGEPIGAVRGGSESSHRLIIDKQGFIDITLPYSSLPSFIDLNNTATMCPEGLVNINLTLPGDGSFSFFITPSIPVHFTGTLKPLPEVSDDDASFLNEMIDSCYVPYQDIQGAPGKDVAEIKALGLRHFPFSPHSFQMAMAVYDWTTASFARMVLMKIFEYTSIPSIPYPLDSPSVATAIWESNWGSYVPSNKFYMNSFMMKPASTLQDVQDQLHDVEARLQRFSTVQNRLLGAAFAAMPRTSIFHAPQLFSGQLDMSQLNLDQFGIEMLECPLNAGPTSQSLTVSFTAAMATFVKVGSIITTKMVWSFADSIDIAKHYQNGLILVVNPPDNDSWVWDGASYITPLSDDPEKNEYTFAPGTSFIVESLDVRDIDEDERNKSVQFLTLKLHVPGSVRDSRTPSRPPLNNIPARRSSGPKSNHHLTNKTGGRRCHCVDDAERN
ncbi:uncharacterized protein EDB93DRAFT_444388 [Suillus bovinus]|uniref:uncharacterized protein n=1 Tax=Suillus bovinus TaxID=48563 RepID=UPI001B88248B|nr:uncharacterized protein EDB93DRAFT_444388 [Suillus bovinus]KAG2159095.1 hypothetical protein EDB93DRAFT_444388 [Suillus bovinus]